MLSGHAPVHSLAGSGSATSGAMLLRKATVPLLGSLRAPPVLRPPGTDAVLAAVPPTAAQVRGWVGKEWQRCKLCAARGPCPHLAHGAHHSNPVLGDSQASAPGAAVPAWLADVFQDANKPTISSVSASTAGELWLICCAPDSTRTPSCCLAAAPCYGLLARWHAPYLILPSAAISPDSFPCLSAARSLRNSKWQVVTGGQASAGWGEKCCC